MRHTSGLHHQESASEPNLFDFVPKSVWREVYRGRWAELRVVQKAEFIVEVVFFGLFIGGLTFGSYREGNVLSLMVWFGLAWLVLGGFFFLLSRFVR
jgi:hypothetical protein